MPNDPDADSIWRHAAAALAFVLVASTVGGAVAGGFTAAAAAAGKFGAAAVSERKEVEGGTRYDIRPDSPTAGFVLGLWRGARFGTAAAVLGLLAAAAPGAPRVRPWRDLRAIGVAAAGAAILAVAAAGVGLTLGCFLPNEGFGYVPRYSAASNPSDSGVLLAAALAREGLFWGGVGWSALAGLWLRAAWRGEDGPV